MRPKRIAIIDGLFLQSPSVLHKEILEALAAGIEVIGASSMGALRAAELCHYGMIGIGTIFQWYRENVIEGDDEVAVLHGTAETEFRQFTIPLVNLRATIGALRRRNAISLEIETAIVTAAKSLSFVDRTLNNILRSAHWIEQADREIVGKLLLDNWIDQKRRDAECLFDYIQSEKWQKPPKIAYRRTSWLRRYLMSVAGPNGLVSDALYLIAARLYAKDYSIVHRRVMEDLILTNMSEEYPAVDDCNLDVLQTVNIRASAMLEMYRARWPHATKMGAIGAAIAFLQNRDSAAWLETPPTSANVSICRLRNPFGDLQDNLFVEAYKLHGAFCEKILDSAKRIEGTTREILHKNNLDLGQISTEFLFKEFLYSRQIMCSQLAPKLPLRGFVDHDDLVDAYRSVYLFERLTFEGRELQELSREIFSAK
jgi:hypothetical protein